MKIYLASPFFNDVERGRVNTVAKRLREQGHEVYVPMEHEVNNAWGLANEVWAQTVFLDDMKAIKNCDEVYTIINNGMSDDAGTCWEIGFAFGINKPVNVLANNREKQSLMIFNGCARVLDFFTMEEIKLKEFEQS